MRAFVLYVLAVVIAAFITPYACSVLHFSGYAGVGVMLVLVWIVNYALGAIPERFVFPRPVPPGPPVS
jgi:hypothetical protein